MREHAFFAHDGVIQEEAARLLADVYSLYEFESYEIFDDPRDTFFDLRSFVSDRMERSLVTLASLARVNDDGGAGLAIHAKERRDGVGLLKENGKEMALTAREACNKIIHAKFSHLDLQRSDSHPIYQHLLDRDFPGQHRTFLRPTLVLAGDRKNGKDWEVYLDVVQWVHAVLLFSTTYGREHG
jgi:hypothetical protein